MSWDKARNSANLLTERLSRIDGICEPMPSPSPATPSLPVYSRVPEAAAPRASTAGIDTSNPPAADDEARGHVDIDDERRIAPRTAQHLNAAIAVPGRPVALPARIVDMSASGARIELQDHGAAEDLPGRFVLVLQHDRSEVDCQIIWRTHAYVGALFLTAPKPMPAEA